MRDLHRKIGFVTGTGCRKLHKRRDKIANACCCIAIFKSNHPVTAIRWYATTKSRFVGSNIAKIYLRCTSTPNRFEIISISIINIFPRSEKKELFECVTLTIRLFLLVCAVFLFTRTVIFPALSVVQNFAIGMCDIFEGLLEWPTNYLPGSSWRRQCINSFKRENRRMLLDSNLKLSGFKISICTSLSNTH